MRLMLPRPAVNLLVFNSLPRLRRPPWWLLAGDLLWLCAIGVGLWILWAYENRPGVAAQPPLQWPSTSRITLATDRPTLLMLVHPRCSCSRASIGELALLMAQTTVPPQTYVLFLKPGQFSDHWEKSSLWYSAASIPHVTVVRDDDGLEARRFGAATSGQTMLYDSHGHLLFSGGITGSRGHSGDNAGRSAILALLHRQAVGPGETFVFGCPLFTPGDQSPSEEMRHHARH
jgi:hypothetical protein